MPGEAQARDCAFCDLAPRREMAITCRLRVYVVPHEQKRLLETGRVLRYNIKGCQERLPGQANHLFLIKRSPKDPEFSVISS